MWNAIRGFLKNMRYNLNEKTVILTGASSGIGREIATRLVKNHSCTVYGIARREGVLCDLRAELGEKFIPTPMDIIIKQGWYDLASSLQEKGVVADILINCAGVLPKFASVEKSSAQDTENAMTVNFLSQVWACEALLPIIKKSPQGAIISFSSSSALCPFAGVSAYCASKSASRAYFECMARENKEIYVASVMNGFVKTDIMKNQSPTEREAKIFNKVCADLDKTVTKILRKIKRKKSRIVVGADAHLMSALYRLFPKTGPKIITAVLKKTKFQLFSDIT